MLARYDITPSMRELFLRDDPIPVGIRVGDLIHGLRVGGADAAGVLDDLRAVVQAEGASLDNVAQVSFFVAHRDLLGSINAAWLKAFPEEADRPTYKFMTADLPQNRPVNLEFFAVANERRRLLHVPNVAHTNPIPLGVRIGRYLFSSRVLPYDGQTGQLPDTAQRQAECVFQNVRGLLDRGAMQPHQITQGRLFLAEASDRQIVEPLWRKLVHAATPQPSLRVTPYALAPSLKVMLEFIAAS